MTPVNPMFDMTDEETQKNPTKVALLALVAIADELAMLAGDARNGGKKLPELAEQAEITAKHFESLAEGIRISLELMLVSAMNKKSDMDKAEKPKMDGNSMAVLVPGSKMMN